MKMLGVVLTAVVAVLAVAYSPGCGAFNGGDGAREVALATTESVETLRAQVRAEQERADAAKAAADAALAAARTDAERAAAEAAVRKAEASQAAVAKSAALTDKIAAYLAMGTNTLTILVKPDGTYDVAAAGASIGSMVGGETGTYITLGTALAGVLFGLFQKKKGETNLQSVAGALDNVAVANPAVNTGLDATWDTFLAGLTPEARAVLEKHNYSSDRFRMSP